ncbi:hypothetical protein IQ07DRAFT_438168 [Pyrenochaeta sp. DS3sAY3a]|nr:hypothetical protein IQ07DRAFT_438168 [Pyrenochaeta sp. DS3sAY3a]
MKLTEGPQSDVIARMPPTALSSPSTKQKSCAIFDSVYILLSPIQVVCTIHGPLIPTTCTRPVNLFWNNCSFRQGRPSDLPRSSPAPKLWLRHALYISSPLTKLSRPCHDTSAILIHNTTCNCWRCKTSSRSSHMAGGRQLPSLVHDKLQPPLCPSHPLVSMIYCQ